MHLSLRSMRIVISTLAMACFSIPTVGQSVSSAQVGPEYRKWLSEDVHWIITARERGDFHGLVTNDERDRFVTAFWDRRNPDVGSKENAFKQEHYRRLAFSNQHFAAGIPGDRTDRGRIYIIFGPPDSIKVSAGSKNRPQENWLYRHIDGVGNDISLKFVDECACGAYKLMNEPQEMSSREPWSAP